MESRFGNDFSDVRVHTDAQAAHSARAIRARAYTVKSDVIFANNHFSPATSEGQKLLAHELAHVIQQRRGGQLRSNIESDMLENAAETAASAVVEGRDPVFVGGASPAGIARRPDLGALGLNAGREPRSLRGSLNTDGLSAAELKQEIETIRQWLTTNPGDTWETDHLRSELERLQAAMQQKESIDVPLEDPKLPNITASPRYIDNIFESVTFYGLNGAFAFEWQEHGKKKTVTIPLKEVEQDDSRQFVALWEMHKTKDDAMRDVATKSVYAPEVEFYSFYERPDGIIMPTSFSIATTPNFHNLWQDLRHDIVEERKDIVKGLQQLANAINPFPGTEVDESGNLKLSSSPLSWLPLLFHIKGMPKLGDSGVHTEPPVVADTPTIQKGEPSGHVDGHALPDSSATASPDSAAKTTVPPDSPPPTAPRSEEVATAKASPKDKPMRQLPGGGRRGTVSTTPSGSKTSKLAQPEVVVRRTAGRTPDPVYSVDPYKPSKMNVAGQYGFRQYEKNGKVYQQAEGRLGMPDEVQTHRDTAAQRKVSRGTGDDAGHLIGNRFGPPGSAENLARQNWVANRVGNYHALEDAWAALRHQGVEIDVQVTDVTRAGEDRPFMRNVQWTETALDGTVKSYELDFANTTTPESRAKAGASTSPSTSGGKVIHLDFGNPDGN